MKKNKGPQTNRWRGKGTAECKIYKVFGGRGAQHRGEQLDFSSWKTFLCAVRELGSCTKPEVESAPGTDRMSCLRHEWQDFDDGRERRASGGWEEAVTRGLTNISKEIFLMKLCEANVTHG